MFGPYESDLGLWGKLWGDLKCFRESLDCCHSGRDTTVKLSSEFTHSSGGQDQLLTSYSLVNKHSHSDNCMFHAYLSKCFHSFTHLILTLLLNGPLTKLSVLLGVPVPSIAGRHRQFHQLYTHTHRLVIAPDVVTPTPCLCLERLKVILNPHHLYIKFLLIFIFFYTLFHPATPTHNKGLLSGWHCVRQAIRPECVGWTEFSFLVPELFETLHGEECGTCTLFSPLGVKDL